MDKKLHMIGNAHLDIVWLWPREEGLQEVKATFKSALDRIEETGDFVFTAAGAYYYKFVEENAPELFARIKQQVEAGNWVIVGGWWLQPDCNLPCGESFARHGLYGQRYFREKFDRQAVVGYNVDSFGHNGNLPQLLKQSGLDYYVFMRPGQHEKELPGSLFEWEAPDGSSVLAYRIPPGYNQSSRWGDRLIDKISGVARMAEEQNRDLMCFYGVGNHGGGPTRDNLQNIKQLQQEGEYNLEFSSPDRYFESVKDRYQHPVVADELQFHAIGCYSAQSEIKNNNRLAENRLLMAEKFGVVARVFQGAGYPGADLRQAWQQVLLNQFHDTLGGCSIKSVYRDARNFQGQALALAGDHLNQALQKLSWNVDTGGEGLPVVVFNPQPWPVEATIEVNRPAEAVFDNQGHEYRAQIVTGKALAPWFNFRTIFRAELPALGYRLFRFRGVDRRLTRDGVELIADRTASPLVLENKHLRVVFDKQLGYIEKIQNKEQGLDYLAEGGYGARPLIIEDPTDTWSHGIESYRGLTGEADCRSVKWVENGPVRDRIRVTHIYGDSTINQDFILDQGSRQLECRVKVDWQQQHRLLKLGFDVGVEQPVFTREIPYCVMSGTADGRERPAQKWVDLSGQLQQSPRFRGGLALINRGKYSYQAEGNQLTMTCLRSPIYAHHDPEQPREQEDYDYIDQGEQEFIYRIFPHTGGWQQTDLVRQAYQFNQPPIPVIETFHQGELPAEASFLEVEADNVVVSVLKIAEDSDAIILRGFETAGEPVTTRIKLTLLNRELEVDFKPFQIKTLRIPAGREGKPEEVNLLEN